MKILIIRNFPSYMAVKNNTYNIQEVGLAKALVRKGQVCDILFWTDREEETVTIPVDETGIVHVFYKHGKTMFKNTVFTDCDDLFNSYDILQPCEYNQMQAWLLAKKYPSKTVIYHGPYFCPFNKRYNLMCRIFDAIFLRLYISRGTKFLTKSELAKDFLVGKGISAENVKSLGVGIDVQMLSNDKSECDESLYCKMKRDTGHLKLLYIGRFEERRDIPFIIDVFKKVYEKNYNARLYMIGTGEKEYMEQCFDYMEKAGVRDEIIWQEKMEQKYLSYIYRQADYFLLPTEYEIFGMVLLEAMYYGNIVLTTRNGGSETLVKDGENGFVFDKKNPEEWACCIIRMHDDCSKQNLCENASETIRQQYTWDVLSGSFIEQYRNCMST